MKVKKKLFSKANIKRVEEPLKPNLNQLILRTTHIRHLRVLEQLIATHKGGTLN